MSSPIQTLTNGLKVVFYPRENYPFLSAQLWVRMGSAFETTQEAGLAHFVEHLAFRLGPANEKPYATQIDSVAGNMNAYTSHLNTVFFANVLSEDAPLAITSLLGILGPLPFKDDDVAKERQVILEEYAKIMGSTYQRNYEQLLKNLDDSGAHAHPLIGTVDNISQVKTQQLAQFRNQHYHTGNSILLLSGGVENTNEFIDLIQSHTLNTGQSIAPFPRNFRLHTPTAFESCDGDTAFVHNVKLVGAYGNTASACAQINQLYINRHLKHPLLAGSQFVPDAQQTAWITSGAIPENKCDPTSLKDIAEQMNRLHVLQLTERQFRATQKSYLLNKLKHEEGITHVYDQGESHASWGDLELHNRQRNCVEVLDYHAYCKTVTQLQNQKAQWHVQVSDALAPFQKEFTKRLIDLKQPGQPSVPSMNMPRKTTPPLVSRNRLESIPLYVRQREDVSTFHCRIAFQGGSFFEERDTQGHTYVLSQLLENAATHAIEHLDALPQGFSGVHSYGLDVYGNQRAAQESLSHIFALLAAPDLSQIAHEDIIKKCTNTSSKIFWYLKDEFYLKQILFGEHPYSLMPRGTPKTVATANPAKLLRHLRQSATQKNLVVAFAGPQEPETVNHWIQREVARLPNEDHSLSVSLPVKSRFDGAIHELRSQGNRRKIRLAYSGLPYGHDDHPYLLFLLYILKRKDGPLYQNVREQSGLTYMLDVHSFISLGMGYFGVVLECAKENVTLILEKLQTSLEQILAEIKNEANFAEWLDGFSKKQRFQNQSLKSHCALACHNHWFGQDFEFHDQMLLRIPQLTHAQLLAYAQTALEPVPTVIVA
ncbi:MAG: hypothetical protein CMH56_16910 [Myxococcales bacterium]|nr:hypothetical protein [Myxococcales bacterium]|tara:strand:+ start:388 stop:2856 length:2469 start_codon:yes stop_codon:yes gene_type:complete